MAHLKGIIEERLTEELLKNLGTFKESTGESAAPGPGNSGKPLPALAMAEAGGEGCLRGSVALTNRNNSKPGLERRELGKEIFNPLSPLAFEFL